MRSFIIAVLLGAVSTFAAPSIAPRGCGNSPSVGQVAKAEAQYVKELAAQGLTPESFGNFAGTRSFPILCNAPILTIWLSFAATSTSIPVYFHVVRSGTVRLGA